VQLSEDIPLEDIGFTVSGASYTDITKNGYGEYIIELIKQSFSDRTSVSVSVNVDGYAVIPKSRSVSVVKEWQPSKIGGEVEWKSAETPPWELGLELVATNEVAVDKHYLLWQLSNNFIITYVEKDKHTFYGAINSLVMDEPSITPGIAIIGGRVYLVHSGGTGSVYRVDVLTGAQNSLTRILGIGSPTKEVGNVGYGNFLIKYSSNGQVSSVHRYYTTTVRTRNETLYGARPFRYPFLYLKYDSFSQAVGTQYWWEAVTALDEETDGAAVEVEGSTTLSIGRTPDDLISSKEPNPQTTIMEFFGRWKALADPDNYALRRLVPVSDTMIVSVWDDTVSLGGAVYPRGMYINRAGQWYFRYADGEEREVEEVLPPMMTKATGLHFWSDGTHVYRIVG